jgi:hypothetical protein
MDLQPLSKGRFPVGSRSPWAASGRKNAAVVGQDFLDLERACGGQALQEGLRPLGALVGQDFKMDPAAGAVDGDA